MAIYLGGQEYESIYVAGQEISEAQAGGNEVFSASSLLPVGARIGNAITITSSRTLIYRSTSFADGTAMVAELSSGGTPVDRVAFNFSPSTVPRITFSDGSVVGLELFTSGGTSFILLQAGAAGTALNQTLTIYAAG